MAKEGRLIDKELDFLKQIVLSLEEAEKKLEEAYKNDKPEQFNAIKKFMVKLDKKMIDFIGQGA